MEDAVQLLILADDFTGALDTGVQCTKYGIHTAVFMNPTSEAWICDATVVVINTDTRHRSSEEAYRMIRELVAHAQEHRVPHIYKKTDSAMRGNVGAELSALLDAAEMKTLPFFPAYPQMQRTVEQGRLFIGGIPVDKTAFGKDPFDPVHTSSILEILEENGTYPAFSITVGEASWPQQRGIAVFDALHVDDLQRAASQWQNNGDFSISAGCAGFAVLLPKLLGLRRSDSLRGVSPALPLRVVCGSVHPTTRQQLRYAEEHGFVHLHLSEMQKLQPDYWQSLEGRRIAKKWAACLREEHPVIFDANSLYEQETGSYSEYSIDQRRQQVMANLGDLVLQLLRPSDIGTWLFTGGDTLYGVMHALQVSQLWPIEELEPGVVLASFFYQGKEHYVITKSGGFGAEDLLVRLCDVLADRQKAIEDANGRRKYAREKESRDEVGRSALAQ